MTFNDFADKFQLSLNAGQRNAVCSVSGATLLLAVPGSGKTTTLTARLAYMVHCLGIAPETILTMTYTVAAAQDMQTRFAQKFGRDIAQRISWRTINGVSARIIRMYELRYNRHAFTLLDSERDSAALLSEIYCRTRAEAAAESDIKAMRSTITYAKNMLLDDAGIQELEKKLNGFGEIFRTYNELLRQREQMDYDDQMLYAWQILRRCPELLAELRGRFRHICVDEAQDTSKIQHMLIELLAKGSESLFMVGDEDQSIYGFRAAYPQALLEFEKTYPGAQILFLEKNYRSTRQIVSLADKFVSKNSNRHQKTMIAARGNGQAVREISVKNRSSQYAWLAKTASNCQRETAVLYRDNDSALPLIDLLEREDIPYRCRQMDTSFFSSRTVRDISDIIRFAYDPTDGSNFMRIYYKLGARISRNAAETAIRTADGRYDILDTLIHLDGIPGWTYYRCTELQANFAAIQSENAGRAVARIAYRMGYCDYLEERGFSESRLQILLALGQNEPSPLRLLERLDELQALVKNNRYGSGIILSTIHSSKGLEYDRVFLMDVIDGILPKARIAADGEIVRDEREAYEEERRIFYVGITRAKNELGIFTFTQQELSSTFAKELFPPNPAEHNGLHYALRPENFTPVPDDVQLDVGSHVIHKKFGEGKIIAKNGDIATIAFFASETRRLSISAALRSGALRKKAQSRGG